MLHKEKNILKQLGENAISRIELKIISRVKGEQDRITVLPQKLIPVLKEQMRKVKNLHEKDLKDGLGRTKLPYALARKYVNADKDFGWQYVFPANGFVYDKEDKLKFRYHIHESVIQKEVKKAIRAAGIVKPGSPHTFRHLPREISYSGVAA